MDFSSSNKQSSDDFATSFGFKKVAIGEKKGLVGKIFSQVAKKYDLMNDLMSLAMHRSWKNQLVAAIDLHNHMQIIDMAAGSADITIRLAKKAQDLRLNYKIQACDLNAEMLAVGKGRCVDANLFSNIDFSVQDGEKTDFANEIFDLYTIAFGIRNFSNLELGLAEAFRILKPGGQFFCLEFCPINHKNGQENSSLNAFFQKFYDFYSFKIIPKIGELVLNDRDSYQYLVESIRKFLAADQFVKLIENAGFINISYQKLTNGICAIHKAEKPN